MPPVKDEPLAVIVPATGTAVDNVIDHTLGEPVTVALPDPIFDRAVNADWIVDAEAV